MTTVFVKTVFDIDCEIFNYVESKNIKPVYRVFVADELFVERTWIWEDVYLEETLQIQALPGRYKIQVKPLVPYHQKFTVSNHRVEHGPARWIDEHCLEILS